MNLDIDVSRFLLVGIMRNLCLLLCVLCVSFSLTEAKQCVHLDRNFNPHEYYIFGDEFKPDGSFTFDFYSSSYQDFSLYFISLHDLKRFINGTRDWFTKGYTQRNVPRAYAHKYQWGITDEIYKLIILNEVKASNEIIGKFCAEKNSIVLLECVVLLALVCLLTCCVVIAVFYSRYKILRAAKIAHEKKNEDDLLLA